MVRKVYVPLRLNSELLTSTDRVAPLCFHSVALTLIWDVQPLNYSLQQYEDARGVILCPHDRRSLGRSHIALLIEIES